MAALPCRRWRRFGGLLGASASGSGNAAGVAAAAAATSRFCLVCYFLVALVMVLPRGAYGLAMMDAECAGTTLFGTEAEIAESPRNDTSTEAVAVGIDGTGVASQVQRSVKTVL